jgi:hypothetical protein
MFAPRYFAPRYFAARYWGPAGDLAVTGILDATEAGDVAAFVGELEAQGGGGILRPVRFGGVSGRRVAGSLEALEVGDFARFELEVIRVAALAAVEAPDRVAIQLEPLAGANLAGLEVGDFARLAGAADWSHDDAELVEILLIAA